LSKQGILEKKAQKKSPPIGWPQAVRDIVIASINKGQAPLLAVAAIVLLMIVKMSADQVNQLVHQVLLRFVDYSIVGWLLAATVAFCWWFHAQRTRKEFNLELARIGEQKSVAQQAAAGRTLPGSRDTRRL